MAAAFVPTTVTVCSSRASKISLGEALTHPGCELRCSRSRSVSASGWRRAVGGRPASQQVQHGRVVQARAEDTLQGRVDLGQQAADPVADAVTCLARSSSKPQSIVSSARLLVGDLDRAQRVRHGAGRFGDDERVPGVGFRLTGVQVRDPAHRQPGQVADGDSRRPGRPRPAGRRSWPAGRRRAGSVPCFASELVDDSSQLGFVVGQRLVEELLPGPVHGNGVVFALADVHADEDINAFVVS